jgi:class 3 adenylate cyclase
VNSRILLIEDEPQNIQAVSAVLKEQGYQVNIATNGRQGLELLERLRPDLILLDVMMPGMDGFEVCRRMKASPAWREIPVIFLTAMNEPTDTVAGFEAGAVDYVSKPFNAHELVARVRTHLKLDQLFRENERLLLNVLPVSIAQKLKKQTGIIAERFDDVSVLFADIVGFTPLSAGMSPAELLEFLNCVFSSFDELAGQYQLEKIKTIGDAYMVVGGLPEPHEDHLASIATMSLAMLENIRQIHRGHHGEIRLRIGLHVGSAVAGVIGVRKFVYDVWGDTVNTASRLESHGVPNRIQVSPAVVERLQNRFEFEFRGTVDLKGRGAMDTFFLLRPKM